MILPAYSYTMDNETFRVAAGDMHLAPATTAIYSDYDGSRLVNRGTIWSESLNGVWFENPGAFIDNKASGSIVGRDGIRVDGDNTTIANKGDIAGSFIGVIVNGAGSKLVNDGTIFGGFSAVDFSAGGLIENSGKIKSSTVAISFDVAGAVKILNKAKGLIQGPEAAIAPDDGRLNLDNRGKIDGDILAVEGNDRIVNTGKIFGSVSLGDGDDRFIFAGGSQGKVYGEAGADRFDFKAKIAPKKDLAKIADFAPGEDMIGLSKALFAGIGPKGDTLKKKHFQKGTKADDQNDRIIYDKDSGRLWYDPDGSGPQGKVLFAKLTNAPNGVKHDDFFVMA